MAEMNEESRAACMCSCSSRGNNSAFSTLTFVISTPSCFVRVFVVAKVHRPGVALALARLEAEGLSNVKIVRGDALIVLMDHIDDRSLHRCCIFFPDPFPSTSER